MGYDDRIKFEALIGKTLVEISGMEDDSDRVEMKDSDGKSYVMHHLQDCCESVSLHDVEGDPKDLLNSPIIIADESTNQDWDEKDQKGSEYKPESHTWTFYRLMTAKGGVVLRWLGESNGYYGEGVDFELMNN